MHQAAEAEGLSYSQWVDRAISESLRAHNRAPKSPRTRTCPKPRGAKDGVDMRRRKDRQRVLAATADHLLGRE